MAQELSDEANDARWNYLPIYIYRSATSGLSDYHLSIRDDELAQVNGQDVTFYPYVFQTRVAAHNECPNYFVALQSANNHRHLLNYVEHNADDKRTHYRFIGEDVARALSPLFGIAIDNLDCIVGRIITRINDAGATFLGEETAGIAEQNVAPHSSLQPSKLSLSIRILLIKHLVIPDFDPVTDVERINSDFRTDESDKESMGASSVYAEDDTWDLDVDQGEEDRGEGANSYLTGNDTNVDCVDGSPVNSLRNLDDEEVLDAGANPDIIDNVVATDPQESSHSQVCQPVNKLAEVLDTGIQKREGNAGFTSSTADAYYPCRDSLRGVQNIDDEMDTDGPVDTGTQLLTCEAMEFLYRAYMLRRAPDPAIEKGIIAAEESQLIEKAFGSNLADHLGAVPQRWFNFLFDVSGAIHAGETVPPFPEVLTLKTKPIAASKHFRSPVLSASLRTCRKHCSIRPTFKAPEWMTLC
jgi:hypothetical protein